MSSCASRTARWLLAVAAAGVGYAYLETKLFTLRRLAVAVLPAGERPIRILHVSDLHLVPRQQRKLAWLRSLADLRPDLVVDTGDNIASPDAIEPLLGALGPLLTDTPGVYVWGSNDYWAPRPKNPARYLLRDARSSLDDVVPLPWDRLGAAFLAAGWEDLSNRRAVVVLRDGRSVSLVGTDDAHLDLDCDPRSIAPIAGAADGTSAALPASAALRSSPALPARTHVVDEDTVLRVGVTHAPYRRVLEGFRCDGADLILAGHTHGGQLCLPFFGALVTNCDLDRGRASGLHGWPGPRPDQPGGAESTWLHVCAGAGTSPYAPVRFACRPEATLLTLTARHS